METVPSSCSYDEVTAYVCNRFRSRLMVASKNARNSRPIVPRVRRKIRSAVQNSRADLSPERSMSPSRSPAFSETMIFVGIRIGNSSSMILAQCRHFEMLMDETNRKFEKWLKSCHSTNSTTPATTTATGDEQRSETLRSALGNG